MSVTRSFTYVNFSILAFSKLFCYKTGSKGEVTLLFQSSLDACFDLKQLGIWRFLSSFGLNISQMTSNACMKLLKSPRCVFPSIIKSSPEENGSKFCKLVLKFKKEPCVWRWQRRRGHFEKSKEDGCWDRSRSQVFTESTRLLAY